MKKEIIFKMDSLYRDAMRITAFMFGGYDNPDAEKACAIVGATRGNEVQQIYICSRIIAILKKLESEGKIATNKKIMVIPTINNYSMNTNKRFWCLDNTDINRMFPGYNLGETTQRIAYDVFENVKNYNYGIQFASYYMPGQFVPHVSVMQTGYEDTEIARAFGLPYVYIRDIRPYDTTTLNYNWQIWGTKAYSIYAGKNSEISELDVEVVIRAVFRFLNRMGICSYSVNEGFNSQVVSSKDFVVLRSKAAGILQRIRKAGDNIVKGELLGKIIDPYDGTIYQEFFAPSDGLIFFIHSDPFIYEETSVFHIIKY